MDDLDPKPQPAKLSDKKLDMLSVAELHIYIEELKQEINRAQEMITHKQSARNTAESVFK